jgi:hypothetical protein
MLVQAVSDMTNYQTSNRTLRKRCRHTAVAPSLVTIVIISQLVAAVSSYLPQQISHRTPFVVNNRHGIQLQSTLRQESSNSNGSGSRFGVRRRVRAVLEKAKKRTGVSNINSGSAETISMPITSSSGVPTGSFRLTTSTGYPSYANTDTSRRSTASVSAPYSRNGSDFSYGIAPAVPRLEPSRMDLSGNVNSLKLSERNDDQYNTATSALPFSLPQLTKEQEAKLARGERVEQQSTMSREGSGYVVMDIPAPDYVIWEALLDFEAYPENIGTVRSMQMFTNEHLKLSYVAEKPIPPGRETRHYGKGSITRAQFVLSKFHLNIAAIHKYVPHPDGHYMEFTLDKACKNIVLRDAKGTWHTQQVTASDGQQVTRLWLLCRLEVSPLLPQFIVDYAARKAMPRATNWVMPTVERLRKEFKLDDRSSFV